MKMTSQIKQCPICNIFSTDTNVERQLHVEAGSQLVNISCQLNLNDLNNNELQHDNSNKVACAPCKDKSAWASVQSDQNSHRVLKG